MTATFTLLTTGYDSLDSRNAHRDGREKPWHVASTVSLLCDGDTIVVVDPGMVEDRKLILDPLAAAGISPEEVTDVVFSHHHPDHTLNAALFPHARAHDVWAATTTTSGTTRPPADTGSLPRSACSKHPATPPRTSPPSRRPPKEPSSSPTPGGASTAPPRTPPPTTTRACAPRREHLRLTLRRPETDPDPAAPDVPPAGTQR
ncbi:MBL fold metallo-hydrolase [Streptomyces qaidamensis]|uniref:MBL fold metallo-hydrolase n=1 Tax=Streptomyces qaidamensis TaxID=1783515 RepID=UPI003651E036